MITPYDYQEEGLEAIWHYFASGKTGNPVLAWPTGVGKSLIPAIFISRIMKIWPNQRFLIITHVKELIQQNYEVMRIAWNEAPAGIYSAGLKRKDIALPIIFGGIQSMVKNPAMFGHRDIIFIDECHLVSQNDNSQYLTFLATMKLINPHVKIIGLSATPFRMGQGRITDDGLFTDIIHDLTGMEEFNRLIAQGYMAPLIPKRTHTQLDVSGVGTANGDFIASQLQGVVDKEKITYAALKEAVEIGQNRGSWLIFSSGIEHAEHISSTLATFGIDCAAVHSKQNSDFNDKAIKAFKSNELRAISCFSKLTTGFNHPPTDFIVDLRPTMSVPLHIQKLGRGTRPANGKENCLVADFSRNVPRLGPINDPILPRKKGDKGGDIPIKVCDSCGAYNHISARFCCDCKEPFHFEVKIVPKAGNTEILRSDIPVVEMFEVQRAIYTKRKKLDKPPYIQVTYFCGVQLFNENVFPEHSGYAKKLFHNWWQQRHNTEPPATTDEALKYISELRVPKRIRVWCNKVYNGKPYPEVLSSEY